MAVTSLALEEVVMVVVVDRRRIRCCWKEVGREEVQRAQGLYGELAGLA